MKYVITLFALITSFLSHAQTPLWAFKIGNITTDGAVDCEVAPSGNIYLAGNFTGTVDLDPGPGTYNVTSVGNEDIFIASYTPAGNFIWGFGIGGSNRDNIHKMAVDASNNVVISGFFGGGGMDFDPGPGLAVIPYAGGAGPTGDGYIAKYSATGGYMWAKDLGGASPFDYTEGLATDEASNIYIGGTFNTFMMASPTLSFTSALAGPAYLIKYDPSGNIIWGHNLGEAAVATNTLMRGITVRNGYIYTCGYFQGNANFCPWGSPTYLTVSAAGGFVDGFIAKYDTAGNIVFAKQIAGLGVPGNADEISGISLDASGDIYVSGWGNSSSYVFDASSPATSTVAAPGGGGNNDIIMAKYSNTGTYQWGKVIGSSGADWSRWALDVVGSEVFISGKFENTVDFDPSSAVANLVSAGGDDAFLAKYDLNGNYKCAFSIGSGIAGESGNGLGHDAAGHIYLAGAFGGIATDFDPNSPVYPLTSAGSTDGFLAKYEYTLPGAYAGNLLRDTTLCYGDTTYLSIHITTGPAGPYDVIINGPAATYTVTGVTSDVPFSIGVLPAGTSSFYVSSAIFAGPGALCETPTATIDDTVTITVLASTAVIATPSVFCDSVIFTAAPGGGTYTWSFGDGTTATGTPVTHTYSAAGTYTVALTTNNGICIASATRMVVVNASAPIAGEPQLCAGTTSLFTNGLSGGTWTCTPSSVATITPFGVMTAIATGVATITYTTSCGQVTKTVTISSITTGIAGPSAVCAGKTCTLTATPAGGIWKSNPISVASINSLGVVAGVGAGTALVTYTLGGCTDTATVVVYPGAAPAKVSSASPTCNEINGTITFEGLQPGETYVMRWQDPINDSTMITADGSGNVVLTPLGPGIYQAISVTNSYGCSSSSAGPIQLVNIAPPPPVIKHNDPCVDQTLFLEGYASPAGGVYQWAFPDGASSTLQHYTRRGVTLAMSGVYSLSYTVNNCRVTATENVTIYTPPTLINMTPDQTIKWGASVQLYVEGAYVYRWAPNDGSIDNPNINNPVVSPGATTRYFVYGANEVGCVDTATVEITVNDDADEFIPTAFTPNGDGLNDIFIIRRLQRSQKLIEFSIYNRYGERVYHNEYSPDAGWDGTYQDQPCDVGTYFYQVILGLRDGTKRVHKGDVTLIR